MFYRGSIVQQNTHWIPDQNRFGNDNLVDKRQILTIQKNIYQIGDHAKLNNGLNNSCSFVAD